MFQICSGKNFNIKAIHSLASGSDSVGISYKWYRTGAPSYPKTTGTILYDLYKNGMDTLRVAVRKPGCISDSTILKINTIPLPRLVIADKSICGKNTLNFLPDSISSANGLPLKNYSISQNPFSTNFSSLALDSSTGRFTAAVNELYQTKTGAIVLKLTDRNNCATTASFNLTLYPNPDLSVVNKDTLSRLIRCSNGSAQFRVSLRNSALNDPNLLPTSFRLSSSSRSDTAVVTSGNVVNFNMKAAIPASDNPFDRQDSTYTIFAKTNKGCLDTALAYARIYPQPTKPLIFGVDSICNSSKGLVFRVDTTSNTNGDISYRWSAKQGGTALVAQAVSDSNSAFNAAIYNAIDNNINSIIVNIKKSFTSITELQTATLSGCMVATDKTVATKSGKSTNGSIYVDTLSKLAGKIVLVLTNSYPNTSYQWLKQNKTTFQNTLYPQASAQYIVFDKADYDADVVSNRIMVRIRNAVAGCQSYIYADPANLKFATAVNEPIANDHFNAFPVPFTDHLTLTFDQISEHSVLVCYELASGKRVWESALNASNNLSMQLETESWNSGLYVIQIIDQNGRTWSKKVSKIK
jgi:hypothetical protein